MEQPNSVTLQLERVSDSDALPATPEIERQLSGAELLWNMPGTAQEKATLRAELLGLPLLEPDFPQTATTSTVGALSLIA